MTARFSGGWLTSIVTIDNPNQKAPPIATGDASSRVRLLYIRLCPLQATSVFWAFRSLADRGLAKAIASRLGSRLVSVVPIAESVCSMVHVAMHLDSRGQR